jgi:hypothetical protein
VEGYYCYFGDASSGQGGVCTNNANKAQPPQDGSFPDGGLAPMLDAPPVPDTTTDSETDAATTPETAPHTDAGTSADTGTLADTGATDGSSSGQ